MSDFQGAHVLITGAASGLGRLMALDAARRKSRVTLLDRDEKGLGLVCSEIHAQGGEAEGFVVDLSNRVAVQATCAEVRSTKGEVDILINNAGIVSGKTLLECSDEAIEHTFQVNALALFWTVRAFLPGMITAGKGHIVTVASAAGLAGTSRLVDYGASKFAAVGFDESLRMDLNAWAAQSAPRWSAPFFIDTGMFEGVKTRFSWLLPILKPDYVVRRTMTAIERNRARLIMPRFVMTVPIVRVFPPLIFDAVLSFFGVNRSMDEFVGRH